MKGYKCFNPDMTCNGFQYKIKKTFTHKSEIRVCQSGFHFCQNANDIFNYYSFNPNNIVCEIEALGEIKTEGDKSVTNKIKICKQIKWQKILEIVNIGINNTGRSNSGDSNSGYRNSGDRNSGDCNSGDRNSGNWNSGNCNSGDRNSGYRNSGYRNSGYRNSGDRNSGDCNSGDRNSGYWNSGNCNSGYRNSGDRNSGDCNSGYWNSGDCNSGDRNSGNWNSGNCNSGYLNTNQPNMRIFNQETELDHSEIIFPHFFSFNLNQWVWWDEMTDKEKKKNQNAYTCDGYLKTIGYKEAWVTSWTQADKQDKKRLFQLPNFNPDIFEEISGIKTHKLWEQFKNEGE